MKFKATDRMALVNKNTMKKLVKYFKKEGCTNFNLSWAVNYLVDIAIGELEAIDIVTMKTELTIWGSWVQTIRQIQALSGVR